MTSADGDTRTVWAEDAAFSYLDDQHHVIHDRASAHPDSKIKANLWAASQFRTRRLTPPSLCRRLQAIRDNPSIKLAQRIAVRNIVSITNPENLDHRSRPALLRRRHGQHRISAGRGRRPERAVSADGLSFFWIETAPLAGRVPAMRDLSSPVERAGRTSVSVRWTKVLRERLTSSRGWIEGRKAVERPFPLFRRFRPFGQASARRA